MFKIAIKYIVKFTKVCIHLTSQDQVFEFLGQVFKN